MALAGWLWPALAALVLTSAQLMVVRRHPEPGADEPDAATKPRYAELFRPPWVAGLIGASLVCLLPLVWLPLPRHAAWAVWGSAGLVLVAVDALTTWLPIRAARLAEAALAGAVACAALVSGPSLQPVGAALLGAVGAGAMFAALWWFSRSLGFGDVRLAAMAGAVSGLGGFELWTTTLLAGTLAAAVWGVCTTLWRRRHPSPLGPVFAYGPGLWLGPYLGLAWLTLMGY